MLLLPCHKDLNSKNRCDFTNNADDELAEADGDNTADQSHQHLEVDITIAEIADHHYIAHCEQNEFHKASVGLVTLLTYLICHDVMALVHNHKHVQQVVYSVVRLTIVKLVSVKACILGVHDWRILDHDWIITLVSEH